MASRSILDLAPELQELCRNHLDQANRAISSLGANAFITCTYRSNQEQAALYAQGREFAGPKVTNAKPGESLHNAVDKETGKPAALAYDLAILENGKLNWDAKSEAWQIVGKAGVSLGLEWAWNWKSFKEAPHFQLPGGGKKKS